MLLRAGDKHQPARNVVASIRHRYRARISKRRINSSRASWCIHRGRYLSKQTLKVYREKFKIKNEFEGKFIFFFFKKINSKFGYDSLSCIFLSMFSLTINGEEGVEIRILWISYQSIGTREKSWHENTWFFGVFYTRNFIRLRDKIWILILLCFRYHFKSFRSFISVKFINIGYSKFIFLIASISLFLSRFKFSYFPVELCCILSNSLYRFLQTSSIPQIQISTLFYATEENKQLKFVNVYIVHSIQILPSLFL